MRAHLRTPSGPLRAFVASLWSFEGRFDHRLERILPSGSIQLLINLHEDETRTYHGPSYRRQRRHAAAVIAGPHAEHFGIDTAEQRCIVGVVFGVAGAAPLLASSAHAMFGGHIDLAEFWGARAAGRLRERLLAAADAERRLDVLEASLEARLARAPDPDPVVVGAAEALQGQAPVAQVLARVGMGRTRFVERFRRAVGMPPKRFARVRRFHRVLRAASGPASIDWAALAADCGYFDQAHLIRDFRAFSGLTPRSYAPRDPAELHHVPVE